jgi:prepilin-type processing-associated H-X9-DG protein
MVASYAASAAGSVRQRTNGDSNPNRLRANVAWADGAVEGDIEAIRLAK